MTITDRSELESYCRSLSKFDFITIDTEFVREKTYYPKLCLIQISDPQKNAMVIDPLEKDLDLSPLFKLLKNQNVLKVFHAARQDLEIFFQLSGKVTDPFFDTQIAAMVCGYGNQIGYESLVRDLLKIQVDKAAQFTDWSQRPLSKRQIDYAVSDVTHLVDIYQILSRRLEEQGRTSWVYEEEEILADPKTYRVDPADMWKKIKIRTPKPKTLAILRELAAWREKKAQERNIPRNWVLRDETLADMAHQAPKTKEALKNIKGIPKDQIDKKIGDTLLKLIEAGINTKPEDRPAVKKKKPPPPSVASAIEILKTLLKIQAKEHDVAAKLIAGADEIEAIARGQTENIPALKGWRYKVFGQTALDLKNGKLAIGLKNGKIEKFKVK